MPNICVIRLLQVRREFDRGYSYLVPSEIVLCRGDICAVPFGKANRPTFGIVTELGEAEETDSLKPILFKLEHPYSLDESMLELCQYFSSHLLCTIGELARVALPVGLTFQTREFVVIHPSSTASTNLTGPAADLYLLLKEGAQIEINSRNREACDFLIRTHRAKKIYLPESAANQKFERVVRLDCDAENPPEGAFVRFALAKVEIYKKLLRYLKALPCRYVPEKELCDRFSVSKQTLATLAARGLIQIEARPVYRAAYPERENLTPPALPRLNQQQTEALDSIESQLKADKGGACLLYGVTGSGKTRVMLHAIAAALAQGKGVIFLVPEIGLTSRAAAELLEAFPSQVSVLHSALSAGERHDAWVALKKGEKKIVLGTRSAVFAPVQNLGLILMDEEQDQSYNADNAPRYHARDIARYRAAHENALLLLASATPDVESFFKAQSGIYSFCRLSERASGAKLPNVQIVDLREDIRQNPDTLIGRHLREAISATLERGEQCLLFMNRRGYQYAPFCPSCGHVITCPNCSVSLTLHNHHGRYACCHYCGYSEAPPAKCPSCGAEHIFFKGYGTQKLEEEIKTLFPKARVLRMDADTVSQKYSHDEIVKRFRAHNADILLGTQMIAKGHDFPDVTLVGVVMADTSLYLGDYRSTEETFSLLTQVIGRAGRAEKEGRAIIQTLNPDHEVFSLAASQDYDNFFQGEIKLRKAVLYPPFCHLSVFTLSSTSEETLCRAAEAFNQRFADVLEEQEEVKLIVYGPIDPTLLRVNLQYRKKFVIKHQNDKRTRRLFEGLMRWFVETQPHNVSLYYDSTPSQI